MSLTSSTEAKNFATEYINNWTPPEIVQADEDIAQATPDVPLQPEATSQPNDAVQELFETLDSLKPISTEALGQLLEYTREELRLVLNECIEKKGIEETRRIVESPQQDDEDTYPELLQDETTAQYLDRVPANWIIMGRTYAQQFYVGVRDRMLTQLGPDTSTEAVQSLFDTTTVTIDDKQLPLGPALIKTNTDVFLALGTMGYMQYPVEKRVAATLALMTSLPDYAVVKTKLAEALDDYKRGSGQNAPEGNLY